MITVPSGQGDMNESCFSAVMPGHWLEPMGEMSGALLNRPILHGVGHNARHLRVERRSLPHRLLQRFIDILGQSFLHDGLVKDHAAKQFGNFLHSNLSHLRRVPGVALAIGFCFTACN